MVQQIIVSLKVKMKTENQAYLQMGRQKVEHSLESLPELHLKQVCKLNKMVISFKDSAGISVFHLRIQTGKKIIFLNLQQVGVIL